MRKEEPKQENCCTPIGQIKRYVDCKGCDRKPNQETLLEAAKKYANIPLDRTVDTEERYFNDATREYDAFIAGAEWQLNQHLPPNKLDT